jgi:hypothetical protein
MNTLIIPLIKHPCNNSGDEFSEHTTQKTDNKNTKPKDANSSIHEARKELKTNFNKATSSSEDASQILKTKIEQTSDATKQGARDIKGYVKRIINHMKN